MYEHYKPAKGQKVTWLKCLRKPHWKDDPANKVDDPNMKRGVITWTEEHFMPGQPDRVILENNRHGVNFDSSCFKVVDENGESIKVPVYETPAKYRFKTKGEHIRNRTWDFTRNCPRKWWPEDNYLLGQEIPNKFNNEVERGNTSNVGSERVTDTMQMVTNNPPTPSYEEEAEEYTRAFESMPNFRFKTRDELINEGLWNASYNIPNGWGNNEEVNIYLGRGIPSKYDADCIEGKGIDLGFTVATEDFYVVTKNSKTNRGDIDKIDLISINPDRFKILEEEERERESMEKMEEVLEKVYDNTNLRKSIVPLFIGNPGLGKTKIIEKFAKKKGAKLVELITSQMSPFEISGIAMPDKDSKKMTYYNFDKIENLKDGDILFFDELLNGNPVVLNACLTILEQRRLISGKELPNIMIIAAANPQGMVPLTPQIKERFLWYTVDFSPIMWRAYMYKKYGMPEIVSEKLCELISEESLTNNNFYTPRSVDKAVSMIMLGCPTPYSDVIKPILNTLISNNSSTEKMQISDTEFINPGESIMWLDSLKKQ